MEPQTDSTAAEPSEESELQLLAPHELHFDYDGKIVDYREVIELPDRSPEEIAEIAERTEDVLDETLGGDADLQVCSVLPRDGEIRARLRIKTSDRFTAVGCLLSELLIVAFEENREAVEQLIDFASAVTDHDLA